MVEMSLAEAQLFRMLTSLFGKDSIVWNMSVRSVCGGEYPTLGSETKEQLAQWAESSHCLFTLVDQDDEPKMVIEIAPDFKTVIEVQQLERHQKLPSMLEACGVQYVSVSSSELDEMMDPSSSLDLVSFLKDRFGIDDDSGEEV